MQTGKLPFARAAHPDKARMDIDYLTPEQVMGALEKAFAVPAPVQERAIDELKQTGWGGL